MQDRQEAYAQDARARLHGEITCALARDHPPRLARLLAKGTVDARGDMIDLAAVMASLASSPAPCVVGIVAPTGHMGLTAAAAPFVHRVDLCRGAGSAALPEGPLSLIELAVYYGARRCLLFLLKARAAPGAHVDPNQCEALLTVFLETRAWRHAVVCWGPCVLLRNRRHHNMVRPMVVAVGPCGGVRMRFFDPMPIIRAFRLAASGATTDDKRLCDRLAAVADTAARLAASVCPQAKDEQTGVRHCVDLPSQ
ncbi:hypothetical protein pneo_cds_697 [Pandoravirus neocaledonia]|uniref:Uncharacterized protein n=1 Tax=Pandoravirus neocaledonia TaxID=2107708 RepID=A0A2U7UCX5_9VIRU|nr:hypothetical protein pneo_cds_697 [Pandoravirus neocaledonia]AVK76304.1 hypothetical protein pneo_cds_697 [Pandoravirus neocaledonia]